MVIGTIGLPRSGKSTFAKKLQTEFGFVIINRGTIRKEMYGQDFFAGGELFVNAVTDNIIKILTAQDINVVINETSILEKYRTQHEQISCQPIHWVMFNTSAKECCKRAVLNNQPELSFVINRFNKQLEIPKKCLCVINKNNELVIDSTKTELICTRQSHLTTYINNIIANNKQES